MERRTLFAGDRLYAKVDLEDFDPFSRLDISCDLAWSVLVGRRARETPQKGFTRSKYRWQRGSTTQRFSVWKVAGKRILGAWGCEAFGKIRQRAHDVSVVRRCSFEQQRMRASDSPGGDDSQEQLRQRE